jgi:vacuolar-type H+-ATPase subunit E/Vma4
LEARKDAVKQIYADAQRRLAELSQGEKYKDLLRLLILQVWKNLIS